MNPNTKRLSEELGERRKVQNAAARSHAARSGRSGSRGRRWCAGGSEPRPDFTALGYFV